MIYIIELQFDTKEEAEQLLSIAKEIVDRYADVTLADIYDLMGCNPAYTDNLKRWRSLDDAIIIWNGKDKKWSMILPKLED